MATKFSRKIYKGDRHLQQRICFSSHQMKPKCAYVTLLTKTSYLPGTLVLDYSLRNVNSQYPLVVMVTSSLPDAARAVLHKRRILVREVDSLYPQKDKHVLAAHDARFADTWTKLRCVVCLIGWEQPIYLPTNTEGLSSLSMRSA